MRPVGEAVAADGVRFPLRGRLQPVPTVPVVLVVPAMGTAARFYRSFARALYSTGLSVVLGDLRGQGERAPNGSRAPAFGYAELVADLAAASTAVRELAPQAPLVLLGHSLGGQLALLQAAHSATGHERPPDAVVLIAAGSVWYGSYGMLCGAGVLIGSQSAALLATALGHWPGDRLGFGGRQPARVMRDWARQARTGRYRLGRHPGTRTEELLRRLRLPVLAVGVEGDRLAPPAAVDHLCGKLPSARVDRWHYTSAEVDGSRLDHFRWARHGTDLARYVAAWTATETAGSGR
nr:alpha/beta fold hydrolase [Streptomyces cupreus]